MRSPSENDRARSITNHTAREGPSQRFKANLAGIPTQVEGSGAHACGWVGSDLSDHSADTGNGAGFAPDQVANQPGPAGLMRRAEASAVVTAEVRVEEQV